eukprot:TRINITY_DN2399_c0_g1_i4.p1 TRINITY_DN2399_c0_g1~~TRINITY_DN2399_c0_g1_i4.p1  ORF type:complete len:701 (-),score=43.34 TRINITY_DN2399_c0_g1_i4:2513-4495(-)
MSQVQNWISPQILSVFLLTLLLTQLLCPTNGQNLQTTCDTIQVKQDCNECFRVLVVWESYRRMMIFENIPTGAEVRDKLPCKFPEIVYDKQETVLELWDSEVWDYYEIEDDTVLKNNSKVNIKEVPYIEVVTNDETKVIDHMLTEKDLRERLLSHYDKTVWPWTEMNSPCEVLTHIAFQRILDVDLSHTGVSMLVWFRLRWNDPRLTWDPSQYSGIDFIYLNQEEFFNPQIEIWNSGESVQSALHQQQAYVNSQGEIFWSRYGIIPLQCDMTGLQRFPYGNSQCKFEVGSWVHNIKKVELSYYKNGYELYNSVTADTYSPFSQYNIESVIVDNHTYENGTFDTIKENNDEWPAVIYNVTIGGHPQSYTLGIIVPQGLLTLVSFAAFWLPPSCDERISFTVTIGLAISVYKLLMYSELPASKYTVFAQKISVASFVFSMIVVIESIFVVILWQRTDPYLFSPLRSIKKLHVDFKMLSAWADVIRAIDVEVTKRKIEIGRRRLGRTLLSLGSKLLGSISQKSAYQDSQTVQEEPEGVGSGSSQTNTSVDSEIPQVQQPVFMHIHSLEDAQMFITSTLDKPKYKRASSSFVRLSKHYSESKVLDTLYRIMGILPGDTPELSDEAIKTYNLKWRKLSNYIDRVSQVTLVPAFVIYIIIISVQVN